LAMTPNKAMGPYEEKPNTAPNTRIQICKGRVQGGIQSQLPSYPPLPEERRC
jgi:hypothetical protein